MLSPDELPSLVDALDKSTVCRGNPDEAYAELAHCRKGIFKDASGENIRAKLDSTPFICDDSFYLCTVRTSDCEILVPGAAKSIDLLYDHSSPKQKLKNLLKRDNSHQARQIGDTLTLPRRRNEQNGEQKRYMYMYIIDVYM